MNAWIPGKQGGGVSAREIFTSSPTNKKRGVEVTFLTRGGGRCQRRYRYYTQLKRRGFLFRLDWTAGEKTFFPFVWVTDGRPSIRNFFSLSFCSRRKVGQVNQR